LTYLFGTSKNDFLSNGFDWILFLSLYRLLIEKQKKFTFKYNSMHRLFAGIAIILFLFSCSHQLSVHQINTRNISVDSSTGNIDSAIQVVVKPYSDSIVYDMSQLVTVSATPLIKGKPESKLTNLVADILLESGINYCNSKKLDVRPDVSYVNYGGLRASLPQGEITVGKIFELMPFENEVVLIKVSGESMLRMAERIAARGGEGIAGMKLGIRNGKVATLMIGSNLVDPFASYWLVTNDYIASGGDQMGMFSDVADRMNTNLKIRDVLIQTLRERYKRDGMIDVKEDGRIYHEQ
jgi:2',3'-cyclic-nucleotide 2'-phosphodiesterase (5'-nucleotidase family)